MSNSWSIFVIVGTLVSIVATFWLIVWSGRQGPTPSETVKDTGHVWDGLTERNEPLPRWWLGLFVLTLFFGIAYLVIFPGMGAFAGTSNWSQQSQYEAEVAAAEAKYAPLFARFAQMPVEELVKNEEALSIGRSLFSNYCIQCHGSLGYGAASFPNLTDQDFLYGDSFASIQQTIVNGRNGIMPALGAVFPDAGAVDQMVEYVRDMSVEQDASSPAHTQYITLCAACHGATGDGNIALGAPRLNDDIWLHGSSPEVVADIIINGRNNAMPAHGNLVGEDRARLLAAYAYSLSQED
ncbi:MAG: cytochrome-c oxidase, cbb3-type subunit III [Pseudomonadota bacterium]